MDYDSAFTFIDASKSDTGYYEFVASSEEDEFKVLHLTDVHIGAGAFSAQKDRWALEAVSTIVHRAKPDLVIVTGDMAYPVPFQAGTFNNKREAEMFAALMEKLGVYWTITFGNHDTEATTTRRYTAFTTVTRSRRRSIWTRRNILTAFSVRVRTT